MLEKLLDSHEFIFFLFSLETFVDNSRLKVVSRKFGTTNFSCWRSFSELKRKSKKWHLPAHLPVKWYVCTGGTVTKCSNSKQNFPIDPQWAWKVLDDGTLFITVMTRRHWSRFFDNYRVSMSYSYLHALHFIF